MPIARRSTPPTSQIKQHFSVLTSLSAWTDTGEEEETKSVKNPYRKLNDDGTEVEATWKEKLQAWLDPESDHFNMIIGIVIISNAAVIGLETEYGEGSYVMLEHLFNACFLVEMILRVRLLGKQYFAEPWNLFDFTLVATGSLDLWVLPLFVNENSTQSKALYQLQAMRMLRMLRLCRVLRVIRLFRMFQQLYLIMQAFGKAFQIVLLMGLLVAILDYVFAIMLTQGIGRNAHKWVGEDQDKIKAWFGTIPQSMQTLFLIMTLTSWEDVSLTLMKVLPSAVVYGVIVLYIMITSYTMLSLITGIISESLITSQQEYRLRKEKEMDAKRKDIAYDLKKSLLNDYLEEDEQDQHGNTRASALKTSLRGDTDLLMKLASINIHITEQGILDLIDKLATEAGIINVDYFVDKLVHLVGAASASSTVDLKYEMAKMTIMVEAIMKKLDVHVEAGVMPKPEEVEIQINRGGGSPAKRSSLTVIGGRSLTTDSPKRNSSVLNKPKFAEE